jgi:trans-aconitate 2-methyltransferase
VSWDASQYLIFAAERARPFDDLVARIATGGPHDVVDLGCGPGNVTRTLCERWPGARVHGIDSSPEMIAAAGRLAGGNLSFALGDVTTWAPDRPVDVIVANAVLQWVPDHVALLPRWVAALRPSGSIAFQMPANSDGRFADALRRVTTSPRWSGSFDGVTRGGSLDPDNSPVRPAAEYADVLGSLGCAVDAWNTTYLHVLPGEDPVLEWFRGTGLRPYLDVLAPDQVDEFRADAAAAFRDAYPPRPYGTPMPFRRVFVVARRQ